MIAKVYATDKRGKGFSWRLFYEDESQLKHSIELNLPKKRAPWLFHVVAQEADHALVRGDYVAVGGLTLASFTFTFLGALTYKEGLAYLKDYNAALSYATRKPRARKVIPVTVRVFTEDGDRSLGLHSYDFSVRSLKSIDYVRIATENPDATAIHVINSGDGALQILDIGLLQTLRNLHMNIQFANMLAGKPNAEV